MNINKVTCNQLNLKAKKEYSPQFNAVFKDKECSLGVLEALIGKRKFRAFKNHFSKRFDEFERVKAGDIDLKVEVLFPITPEIRDKRGLVLNVESDFNNHRLGWVQVWENLAGIKPKTLVDQFFEYINQAAVALNSANKEAVLKRLSSKSPIIIQSPEKPSVPPQLEQVLGRLSFSPELGDLTFVAQGQKNLGRLN